MESHFLVEIEKALVIFCICACSRLVMPGFYYAQIKSMLAIPHSKDDRREKMEKVWVLKDTTEQQNYQ